MRGNNPAVDYGPLEANGFKKNLKRFAYQKRMIWYYKYGGGGEKYITFLENRAAQEMSAMGGSLPLRSSRKRLTLPPLRGPAPQRPVGGTAPYALI
jgi:hypothetical protein